MNETKKTTMFDNAIKSQDSAFTSSKKQHIGQYRNLYR